MEHRIVVGVDGSPGSDAALRWVTAHARTSGHTGLVLGSVSRRGTDRATCPVVIVPTA